MLWKKSDTALALKVINLGILLVDGGYLVSGFPIPKRSWIYVQIQLCPGTG
jgi:hypothetical protein